MGFRLYFTAFLNTVCLLAVPFAADATVVFDVRAEKKNITAEAGYFIDAAEAHTIRSVSELPAQSFTPVAKPILNLGITDASLWLRFVVRNEHPFERPILEFSNPRMSHVDLYTLLSGGQFAVQRGGAEYPFYLQEIYHATPAFSLAVAPGEERVFYLRVANTGNLRFWLTLWDQEAFHRYSVWANIGNLIVVGALAALVLFNLIVFLTLRERGYLFLALFVLVFLFVHMTSTGIGAMLLWPDAPWMGERGPSTLIMLCFGMSALFAASMVPPRSLHPLWSWLGPLLGGASVAGAAVAVFAPGITRIYLLVPVSLVVPGYMVALGLAMWRGRVPYARLFVLSWGSLCAAVVVITLVGLRVVEFPGRGEFLLALVFIWAAMLWCFALTGRVKQREKDVRAMLETQVRERTAELSQALSEVKTLSGLLPMCARCKKIREDSGYWKSVDTYLRDHTGVETSHGICPECMEDLYPEFVARHGVPSAASKKPAHQEEP